MLYRRSLALLLLAAFIIGLAGDLLRRGDEYAIHVVCPEHGEILHAQPSRPVGAHSIKALPTSAHTNGCELAVMGPTPTPAPPPELISAPLLTLTLLPAPADAPTRDRRAVAVLGYAPKTSPPAFLFV